MLADSGEVSEVMFLDLQRSKNNQECEYRELEFDLWREEMLKSKEALQIRERELEANVRMADDQVKIGAETKNANTLERITIL